MKKQDRYPIIPPARLDDLHNLEVADSCDLALFMAGNQFMVMKDLLSAFRSARPEVKKIYYETLPPGLELKQILAGGAVFQDRLINAYPDIYTSVNEAAMVKLVDTGHMEKGAYHPYLHNRIVLMVPEDNPGGIKTVRDLAKDRIRISQPDPLNEDIAFYIMDMYRKAGGQTLVSRIMEEKRSEGTTILTIVHHRETPLRLRKRTVDVGPVWATEAIHAKNTGMPFGMIEPGEDLDQRDKITYLAGKTKNAPHPENAQLFLDFIRSEKASDIYKAHGFIPEG